MMEMESLLSALCSLTGLIIFPKKQVPIYSIFHYITFTTLTFIMNSIPDDVPHQYICPITKQLMVRPMMTKTGFNFERDAIIAWVNDYGSCPLTRQPLRKGDVVTNHALKMKIMFWCRNNQVDLPSMDQDEHLYKSIDTASINLHYTQREAIRQKLKDHGTLTLNEAASMLPITHEVSMLTGRPNRRGHEQLSNLLADVMVEL
jgi:hypothetical protein